MRRGRGRAPSEQAIGRQQRGGRSARCSLPLRAYGGFFIPKSYGTSISLTGGPEAALMIFIVFYLTCIASRAWY